MKKCDRLFACWESMDRDLYESHAVEPDGTINALLVRNLDNLLTNAGAVPAGDVLLRKSSSRSGRELVFVAERRGLVPDMPNIMPRFNLFPRLRRMVGRTT